VNCCGYYGYYSQKKYGVKIKAFLRISESSEAYILRLSGTTIHYITALGLESNISMKRAISLHMVVWKAKDAEKCL